ncbi:MAG TPA: PIF1 family DEAD/DEAH box helicase [Candidatus Saccharimonadales bacterium]|jgi:ATP-dependent exoDNAse (exonuclease V) alpha subunit
MTQDKALKIMLSGSNIFLTGSPGSGKTYLLNEYISRARKRGLKVAVTATTGIAATHLDGITIHSWAGIGLSEHLTDKDKLKIFKNQKLVNRYKFTDVLVIDEVSMLSGSRLDLVNELSRMIRKSNEVMGGIQLILVGDLFQLPPVNARPDQYVFNSQTWQSANLKICYLSEQHRQQLGDELNSILQIIRANKISEVELAVLSSKLNSSSNISSNVLRLYSHNFDADELNEKNINRLKSREKVYRMRTKGSKNEVTKLKNSILSPETLKLKVGCQVIFTANNYKEGYVNGDRGRVVDLKGGLPIVRMNRAAYLKVKPHHYRAEVGEDTLAEAWQLPLKLAWAITIHKSQGMSLDEAEIDLARAFSPGMGYVALSRLKTIDGLHLLGLNKMALYVDHNVAKIDRILRAESDKLM